jgi:hypothetical protein
MLSFYRDALGFEVADVDPGAPRVPMVNWVSSRTRMVTIELFDAAKDPERNWLQIYEVLDRPS